MASTSLLTQASAQTATTAVTPTVFPTVLQTRAPTSSAPVLAQTVTPTVTLAAPAKPQPDGQAARRVARVPILMYHYISTPPKGADRYRVDLSVTPQNFESQLAYLAANGFTSVGLDDVYNYLATGAPLPAKPVVLTFDDGYRDAYDIAFPLLQKYKMRGTFFIISDFINSGNPAYLTWDMVKQLSLAGMSIESHTRTHPDMRNRSNDYLVWQIVGPIEAITTYTGTAPRFFCYPSGKYDDAVIRVLRSVNTWAAVTTQYGAVQTLTGAMTWSRLRVHGATSLAQFTALLHLSAPAK